MIKVYTAEEKGLTQVVMESTLGGFKERDRFPPYTSKETAVRRSQIRVWAIIAKALLKGDVVKIEIDTGE